MRFSILCLLLLLGTGLFGQVGSLSGTIVDKKNGEVLIGAKIRIADTTMGGVSDLNGKFVIKNIPVGKHLIVVQMVSYEKDTQEIEIKEGQNTVLNVSIGTVAVEKKEVKIVQKRSRETLAALTIVQKNSAVVADGISSDVIRKSPDRNTGDVVKRVSGASLQENKFAIVRGLSDRYNNAMLNNTLLSSTEADRKAFSFDLIPSAAIDNLFIFKTASPDLSGDFGGGIIQVTTKDIPEEKFNTINISGNINLQSTFKEFYLQQDGKGDLWGLSNRSRNIPEVMPQDNKFNFLPIKDKIAISKQFGNTFSPVQTNALPGMGIQYTNGTNVKKEKFEFGSIFSMNYSNNFRLTPSERYSYNASAEKEYSALDTQYKNQIVLGGLWNLGFKFGTNHKLNFLNLFNNNAESMVLDRTAADLTSEDSIHQSINQFLKNTLQSHQISGENCFGEKCYRLKYQAGVNILNTSVPDLRRSYYTKAYNDPEDTNYTAFAAFSPDPKAGGRFYSKLKEYAFFAGADFSVPYTLMNQKQLFKFGFYEQVKTRKFETQLLGYVITNISSFDYGIKDLSIEKIYDTANMGNKGFVLRESYNPEDRYSALSNLFAGFLMSDNKVSDKNRFVWGVRIEEFGQELYNPYKGVDSLQARHIYIDVLPSFNFIHSINDRTNLRFSVSKTLSRPEFRELSRFRFYDFTSNATIEGNPDLIRTDIYNADVRYEIFQKFGQMFTVSGFFKYFTNPIEQSVEFTGPETRVKSYVNAESAINFGAETEFRLRFATILNKPENKTLNALMISLNAAYIYSNVKFNDTLKYLPARALQGQSPFVINANLQYQDPDNGWGAAIFYNVVGNRISEVGNAASGKPNVLERSRNLLDFQISKKLSKHADLRLTVNDILAQNTVFFVDFSGALNTRKEFVVQRNAQTFSISFSYKF